MAIFSSQSAVCGKRRGQALVEVLVAISVLTIGFLSIVTLLARALSLNRVVADSYVGTYLAAEGIEVTKNILDGNIIQGHEWNYGISPGAYEVGPDSKTLNERFSSGRKLLYDSQTHLYNYANGIETPYVRKITITAIGNGASELQVNSEVSWTTRGGGQSRVNVEDHFYNWR